MAVLNSAACKRKQEKCTKPFVSRWFLIAHISDGSLGGIVHGFDNDCLSEFRGFLQFENITYRIEPLESSARFEHIVYQVKNGNSTLAKNYSRIWQIDQPDKGHFNAQVTIGVVVVRSTVESLPLSISHEERLD